MYAARILYPVRVLGPGERIGLWLSGCKRACPGCSNPELWEQKPEQQVSVSALATLIRRIAAGHPVDGLTITGGEPFDQCADLARLLEAVADVTRDVLIYTGSTLEELHARQCPDTEAVLVRTAVLIDGPYVETRNTASPLRGSDNQRIHYLQPDVRAAYEAFMQHPNRIQNFTLGGSTISVGIHQADYADALPACAARKGLISHD